jgi:hypothetical protein
MTVLRYPSEQFPTFPSIEISTPSDWSPATVPGAVLAARADTAPGRFAPNVVVTVARYTAQFGRAEALTLLRDSLRAYPDAKIDDPFDAAFGDDRYLLVNVAYDDPAAGTLVQVHAYCAFAIGAGHEGHRDVVHVMGTCAAVDTSTDYPLLQQVMESVRVTPHVPAEAGLEVTTG